jgi:hypothetical protein
MENLPSLWENQPTQMVSLILWIALKKMTVRNGIVGVRYEVLILYGWVLTES